MPSQTLKDFVSRADIRAVSRFPDLCFERLAYQDWRVEMPALIEFLRDCRIEQENVNHISTCSTCALEVVLYWYARWTKQSGKQCEDVEKFLGDLAGQVPSNEENTQKNATSNRHRQDDYLAFPSLCFVRTGYGEWKARTDVLIQFLKAGQYRATRIDEITSNELKSLDAINAWYAVYYRLTKNKCDALETVLKERHIPIISLVDYQ
jgi:hypothetical protein